MFIAVKARFVDDLVEQTGLRLRSNRRGGGPYKADYADKYLKVDFTIEDPGTFTTPWNAVMIYLRDREAFPEVVCAEGRMGFHNDEGGQIPTAAKPDF